LIVHSLLVHSFYFAALFVSVISAVAVSSTLYAVSPGKGGLTKEKIAEIDSIFAPFANDSTPGCAVAVFKDGKILFQKGYGMANIAKHERITPTSVFCIGSVTKQFTGACILLLAQQGKLSLEDDIHKYLPEIPNYGKKITIRNLLNHTSGLREYNGLLSMEGWSDTSVAKPKDALKVLSLQKGLEFDPGTKLRYCNSGYFLAGQIVERVSGKPIRQFAMENIFRPLGMKNTQYFTSHNVKIPHMAVGYQETETGFEPSYDYWETVGSTGIYTTVADLLKWDDQFYKPKIATPALFQEMQRRAVLATGDTEDYCIGLYYENHHGLQTIGHGGATSSYMANFLRVPEQHLSVVLLSNNTSADPDELADEVIGVVAEHSAEPTVNADMAPILSSPTHGKIDTSLFKCYTGEYALDNANQVTVKVTLEANNELGMQPDGQPKYLFTATDDSSFYNAEREILLTFHTLENGKSSGFNVRSNYTNSAHRITRETPSATELRMYEGNYYSPELDVTYAVTAKEGALVIAPPGLEQAEIAPPRTAYSTSFTGDKWYARLVNFEKNDQGKITAMLVNAGRIKNMRFEKR